MKPKLTLTQGLPGSGKSTWAREEAARTGAVLLGLDGLRTVLHGGWRGDSRSETQVRLVQYEGVCGLLRAHYDVIVDDVGLDRAYASPLEYAAGLLGAELVIEDRFLAVPLAVCIERDAGRPHPVGAEAIRSLAARYRVETRA